MGGQESFIYSFVARGTMVLAEYTEFTGNFPAIAAQCLQRLPSSNNKFTYKCDHHIFNFLVEDGYAYCVVAKESVGKQISIALLERIKADFKKRYGGGKADTAVAKSLNKEFGPLMKEHMQYIIDHADEIEKLLKVKAQVSEVKSIMLENIDKAQEYKKRGQQIRRKMWGAVEEDIICTAADIIARQEHLLEKRSPSSIPHGQRKTKAGNPTDYKMGRGGPF
ncbi:Vesicle-associated membrane protein [Sesamum angolense]|uniref:Vesicle-associated membrane protein n=1 Tax=Sesamum angolense TaxID=2727404 RepID=A0AAE2C1H3_9LAMI|nr:Vesicle-associated membrane protein [Sesamum angolense]